MRHYTDFDLKFNTRKVRQGRTMNSPFQLGPKRPHRQTIEIEKDNYREFYHFECKNYLVSTLLCFVLSAIASISYFFFLLYHFKIHGAEDEMRCTTVSFYLVSMFASKGFI